MSQSEQKWITPVRRRTVQKRIRSGRTNEGCRAQEENVGGLPNLRALPRKAAEREAKAKHRQQITQAHARRHETRVERSETAKKPSTCSSRGFGSIDHTTWNHNTAYSADLASSQSCSWRTATAVSPPRPAQQMRIAEPFPQTL